jgi:AraC-like DNA-binding protein
VPLIGAKAQQKSTDTLLNMVLSEPYFYNLVGSSNGQIFLGTSKGVMQVEGKDFSTVNRERGYITLSKQGKPIKSEKGISNYRERKYLHLLPYPEQSRDEFHAGTKSNFYICSGGRLYIFDILPYSYGYANHSIRTISNQFVGTYSGIYRNGIRIGHPYAPPFTDGYVREIESNAFLCYDYLIKYDLKDTLSHGKFLNVGVKVGGVRDIAFSVDHNSYFVFATQYIFSADYNFDSTKTIYTSTNDKKNITYVGFNKDVKDFLFTDDRLLLRITFQNQIDTLFQFDDSILAGTIVGNHTYLLSSNKLFIYNHNRSTEKINLSITKAHSLVPISETELVISSDEGLYQLNTLTKELLPLIIGVEFNRRALFNNNGKIYAGSINGLYTLSENKLKSISAEILKSQKNRSEIPQSIYLIAGTAICTILLLLYFLFKTRTQLKNKIIQIEESTSKSIDRQSIEDYIRNNLPNASLKSIAEYFNTNNSYVYRLLAPDKPGTIISQIRKEMVEEMKKEDKSAAEISARTGLSKSYISKI